MKHKAIILIVSLLQLCACGRRADVIVVGGGAGGTAAGIQAARLGANTLIIEQTPWLGGMLTSAGVSAIDGNYRLRSGIFGEFCDSLARHYGGYEALKTGWVSNILFEPHIGAEVLAGIAASEPSLRVLTYCDYDNVSKCPRGWKVEAGGRTWRCKVLIDGTELGDVARSCGVPYEKGNAEGIVQDMTYVLTIQDYGSDADRTLPEPQGYDRSLYVNCCLNPLNTLIFEKGQTLWSPEMMMSYGLLPGGKIMLNWPIEGNDFYADIIDAGPQEREMAFRAAKDKALGYLYFIQTELGMKNYGLAEGEYPSDDGLSFFPYYRESRRIEGQTRFTFEDASDPYGGTSYRAGVAPGDYPVDHHHYQHPQWKRLHKSYTAIPSFSVPAGVLVPAGADGLLVAEKSVSVDNSIAGTTRLQPVVMELGQAAGVIAALSVRKGIPLRDVSVRELQSVLLEAGARIQPYLDLPVEDSDFQALQRIGSTGILRAEGRNVDWADEMWMRTADTLKWNELYLEEYYGVPCWASDGPVTVSELYDIVGKLSDTDLSALAQDEPDRPVTRLEAVRIIDSYLHPFESVDVDWGGGLKK